ncbi:MAG TPA: hypothetical protein VEW74_05255, partial [Candidatus Nitrosotalea sp.]|nr:hypothetical protein [Candidatus Nitrosotalea sp.]
SAPAIGRRTAIAFPRRGIAAWWLPVAAAAALIIGLLIPRGGTPRHDLAMVAMLHSHFSHAQFAGAQDAPAAKVLYAHDRSWYYVIVEGQHRYEVYGVPSGQRFPLGSTEPRGTTSELFVRRGRTFDRVELDNRGAALETAAIR